MQQMKLKRSSQYSIYFIFITTLFLLVVFSGVYILSIDYDALIASVVHNAQKNGLENKLRNEAFTRQRFQWLQQCTYAMLGLAVVFFWLAIRFRYSIVFFCRFSMLSLRQCAKGIKNVFSANTAGQNFVFFACLALVSLLYTCVMLNTFLNYDEMWCYNYYTSNHFYYSFFTYSSYPFFEMTTHFFKGLPFSMKVNLRLSSVVTGIACCFLLYACLRRYFNNHFTAMAGWLVFALMPLTILYASSARGVIHEMFFAIAVIFSFLFWAERPEEKRYLVIYCFAGILGTYAIPTNIILLFFVLVTCIFTVLRKNRQLVPLFLKVNLLMVAGICILYAPMLLSTGLSVFNTMDGLKVPYTRIVLRWPYYLSGLLVYFAGYGYTSLILISAGYIFVLLKCRKMTPSLQRMLLVVTGLPLAVLFFFFITRLKFLGRSVAFCALGLPFLTSLLLQGALPEFLQNRWTKNILGLAAIASLLLLYLHFHTAENVNDKNVAGVSRLFLDKGIASCYDNTSHAAGFYYYYPGLEYYYRNAHKKIELTVAATNSMRYKPLTAVDYDCIVFDAGATDSSRSASFHECYRDPSGKFKIWIRNDLIKKPR